MTHHQKQKQKQHQRRAFPMRLTSSERDERAWQERQIVHFLQLSIEAEREWITHLQSRGIDISGYPSADLPIPELGITHHQIFFPDALNAQFHQWFKEEFFPRNAADPNHLDG